MSRHAARRPSQGSPGTTAWEGRPRYLKLLPLGEATHLVSNSSFRTVGSELVYADRASGRVCAETVRSRSDIPESTTSAMDGYAVRSADTTDASRSDPVRLRLLPASTRIRKGEATEVSTGERLPAGSDAVLRVERARLGGGALVVSEPVPRWKNVSLSGEDVRAGQVIFRAGSVISPAGAALLISAGVHRVRVARVPRVGIISVGRGLTGFRERRPGKTVNNYANLLQGYFEEFGATATIVGVADGDGPAVGRAIERASRLFDILVTVGGVSVGRGDLVPESVLRCSGSKMIFHGLRAVPLRPAGLASVKGRPVVLVPGKAVSAALAFFEVALPVLNVISGLEPDARRAVLLARATEEFANDRPMDAFLLATVENRGGVYSARPLGWGSNLQHNLAIANGFVRLGPRERVPAGGTLPVELLGPSQIARIPG